MAIGLLHPVIRVQGVPGVAGAQLSGGVPGKLGVRRFLRRSLQQLALHVGWRRLRWLVFVLCIN